MRHIIQAASATLLALALLFTGCSEDTGSLGVYPTQDAISSSDGTFDVLSTSVANNNVPASSTACYLGKVIDPETDKAITATFATQFHTFENYTFPDRANIITTTEGLLCQSIEIRLFIKDTFGDRNNPMKVEVWPLSWNEDKMLKESQKLYTDTDLRQFADMDGSPIATKVFTATDYILTQAQRSSNYSDNVRIVLDPKIGDAIIQKYYDDPANFRDSYSFIRNVCPGFLFQTVGGIGTMLHLEVCTMNIEFMYKDNDGNTVSANCRFAATPEVIQSTQFESSDLSALIEKMNSEESDATMLKTPAGICTELILPINDIYRGHENDSISRASITLTRFNNQDPDAKNEDYALGIPQNLLLVRKQNIRSFFDNHQVSDSRQSFTTDFQPTYNSYSFANIGNLIAYCIHEKKTGMMATGMTEEDWEKKHPDWNHVMLIPVAITTTKDAYDIVSEVSVNQDMSLCSTKLVRGTKANPIKMQVIFSRYAK